jgi:DnaK suppressor protein
VKPQPKAKAAKPAAKKPVAKPAKPAAKAPAKAPAKPVAKAAKKAAPKAAAKKAPAKKVPAKKPVAKKPVPAKAPARSTAKPVAKPAVKPAAKAGQAAKPHPAAKAPVTAAKAPVKATKAAPPAQAPAPAKPAPQAQAARAEKQAVRPALVPVAPAQPVHAPAAAKASYIPTMTTELKPPPVVAVKKDPKLANNWKTKSAEELSDEEVLAMPDGEYMNDKQLAFFRLKLLKLKEEILNSAGETTEHLREDTVIVPDPADRATIEEEHALELRTRDRERKLLKKIEQSIARIDASDYGYCDETGEPIGVARLLARPTATLSLEAQQRRELKQKMFGD